ncbi:MAG: EAL domain-containing protein [Oceanospirillales bacterium]|nr:EAL domain-containing protein [Oceanospirillales bacterium]
MNDWVSSRSSKVCSLLAVLVMGSITLIWTLNDVLVVNAALTLSLLLILGVGCLQLRQYRRLCEDSHLDRLTRRSRELPYIGLSLMSLDDDRWLWNNPSFSQLFGGSTAQLSTEDFLKVLEPSERLRADEIYARFKSGEQQYMHVEHRIRRLDDGSERWIEFDLHLQTDLDQRRYLLATAHDITEQRQALRSIQRQRDLYETLSQTNKTIVRAKDRQTLLDSICTVAVNHGHLCHAWVGHFVGTELKPMAWASENLQVLEQVFEGINDVSREAPTYKALREDRVSVCNNIHEHTWDDFTVDLAKRAGIASIAVFPLHQEGEVIGNLTLYSKEAEFFDPLVMRTLAEMAGDIGYALNNLERQQALETANQIIESSPVVVLRWSSKPGNQLLFASENILRWGYRSADLQNTPLMSLVSPQDRSRLEHLIQGVVSRGDQLSQCRFRVLTGDGETRWVEAQIICHATGDQSGCLEALVRDVHARKQHEDSLNLAAAVFRSTREGVVITDANQRILEINPACSAMLGYEPEEVIGKTPKLFSSGRHGADFYATMWRDLQAEGYWQGEIWNRRRDGQLIPELLSITRVDDPDGGERRYVAVFADVSEIKRSSEKIEFLAHTDPVTGLPNRALFQSMLEQAIRSGKRQSHEVALLILDLDHFKDINDGYGHGIGDELLQQVAQRLQQHLRGSDSLARLGGDEFAVLLTDLGRQLDAASVARQLIELMSEPFHLSNGADIQSGVSIGISLNQHADDHDAQEMLKQADAALYKAKSLGRGSFSYYSNDLSKRAAERLDMEVRLRRAMQQGLLEVHYQPQVEITTGQIIGAEALVRWHDEERGYIPPDQFIPLAEQSELIVKLGDWVLEQVCRQGKAWLDQGYPELQLAVNLSPGQMRSNDLVTRIAEIVNRTGYPARLLELELTEGALMHDPEVATQRLTELRELGICLALDDFGTGYSSLAYLKRFPLSVLKIDKSFVRGLPVDSDDCAISRTVVAMGHSLGMSVLAEGVETEQQLKYLQGLGCDIYQGFLCSPALPEQSFIELLRAGESGANQPC